MHIVIPLCLCAVWHKNTLTHMHDHLYTHCLEKSQVCSFVHEYKTNFSDCSSTLSLTPLSSFLCFFFSLPGLQGLVNPVLHLAQLFDLDLALWYSPS